jgi:hypothetical protein
MAYIGTKPTIGNFQICDAISVVNGQAAYTMQVGSVNVLPQSANHMIVSLNGVIQKPGSSFTVSGSTITFASNLATGDVIDFIQILGDVLDLGTPSDATVSTAKLADNAVTAAKITDSTITAAKLASGTVQNQSAFKNIIINGDMSIAQRGTSTTGIGTSNGYFSCDRWKTGTSGTNTLRFTQSQSTDVPSGQGFPFSLKMDCTTADASLSSGDRIEISPRFEGQNLQYLKKGTSSAESLTLSFWVKSNKTGTYIAELFDTNNTRQISQAYTIDSASTWEKKTLTFAGDTTGVFTNDNNASLQVSWFLAAGSNMTSGTLSTTWTSNTNANRAVGQVNLADSTSNEWYVTGVQLEVGSAASDFEFLPFDVNLARCHRYCYVMGASQNAENLGQITIGTGMCRSSGSAIFTDIVGSYPQPLRTEPTLTQVGGDLADVFCYKTNGTSANPTSISVYRNTIALRLVNNMGLSSGLTAGDATVQQIQESDTDLVFDAEL